jgi:hypothetical protein
MRQNRDEIQELREGHDEEEEGKKTPMEKEGGWMERQTESVAMEMGGKLRGIMLFYYMLFEQLLCVLA